MKIILVPVAALALAGCAPPQPLTDYRPVVDPARSNQARYESDLDACLAIATQVEADYQRRQNEELGRNLVIGLLVGAVAGAAIGGNSDWAAYGAASGAAAGAGASEYSNDLVTYGPRRVVDRCMEDRGHRVLNDLGRA